ncbi:SET and MYND domain-containing protein 4 [Colletotrichum trifolii]|uniref:SET and MYND domain-containing protein 4 n=1 Tax=Colletotrichum trifolii TaxID=5466 RepID=A0A4R8RMP1_COLTR|nr:SET and MYND domain-containing protein 4 [Colletotrichum trifolii]
MDVKDVSDVKEFDSYLQRLKEAAERAGSRKGEIPSDHPSAGTLISEFMMARFSSLGRCSGGGDGQTILTTTQVPPPYPPCVRPTASLRPLPISKMKLEEHNRGKQVVIRTMTPTDRINGILAVAEDEAGTAVLLQLYNQPEEIHADELLPQNSICMIKEPFLKVTTSGGYSLRVDHVDDILHLSGNDERIPQRWRSLKPVGGNSEEARMQGNAAVKQLNWGRAERLYSDALSFAETVEQKKAALLNRSLANLRLQRPEKALADALRARHGGEATEKGLFREAKACYGLEQFSLCLEKLQQVVDLNPNNQDAKTEIKRVTRRIREQMAGQYMWKQMHEQASMTPPLIDCATFSAPVEVRPSLGRGNGLFTTKAVKAGDLLFCEKAFAYSYAAEDDAVSRRNIKMLMNLGTKRMTVGGQASLIAMIVQKLHHNPQLASRFTELHHGEYHSAEPSSSEEPSTDSFLVERIVSLNCFGAPRSTLKTMERLHGEKDMKHTTCGVWTIASHVNHSCAGNCRRSFIGDMMVVRAAQDVDAGTELLFCYQQPNPGDDYQATQKRLKNWGFTCRCELCEDKKSTSSQTLHRRRALLGDLHQAMKSCETAAQQSQAEKLLRQLETCYPERKGALRLELWDSYLGLAQKRLERGKAAEALELKVKSLEALGFFLVASPPRKARGKPQLEIQKWGQVNDLVPTAFLGMAHAYKVLAPELCEVAKSYARTAYAVCIGEKETAVNLYEDLQ